MNKFELSAAFFIGHENIDSDHVELVRILNDMVDGFVAGDVEVCRNGWQQFCTKLDQHFNEEAKIMSDLGYVDDVEDDHQEILDHVTALGKRDNSLDDWEACLFEMRNHLLSWILKKDLLFAEHLVTIGYNDADRKKSYKEKKSQVKGSFS